MPILSKTDNKKLLRIIHIVWNPVVIRFKVFPYDLIVLTRILDLIEVLGEFGRDFITRKFIDDVWPPLKKAIELELKKKPASGTLI